MVERIRAELAAEGESDAAVVERALNAYLLGRLLERTQAAAGLSEEDAERVAYEELHAAVEHDPPGVSAEDIRRRAGTRPATPEEIASFHEQFGPFDADGDG